MKEEEGWGREGGRRGRKQKERRRREKEGGRRSGEGGRKEWGRVGDEGRIGEGGGFPWKWILRLVSFWAVFGLT